jgi:hypothetical protein
MPRRRALLATVAVLALPALAFAHHGWGGFDNTKVLDHTGPIARSTYANPHGTLWMVKDNVEMVIELAPVSRMQARGLAAADLAAGKTVRVNAYQNRGNPNVYRAEWVEVDGGRRVQLR